MPKKTEKRVDNNHYDSFVKEARAANNTKKCCDCNLTLDLSKFSRRANLNKSNAIYFKSECKDCMVLRTKEWQVKNREVYLRYLRKYRKSKRQTAK